MAKPTITLDNTMLLKRMKQLEEVTGKEVASSLRRGGRLLAVGLARVTPPFGLTTKDKILDDGSEEMSSLHKGENALLRDLFRLFYVMRIERIRSIVDFQGTSASYKYAHKGASPIGEVKELVLTRGQMKGFHEARRGVNGRVSKARRGVTTGHRFKDLINLDKGIVTKEYVDSYYTEKVKNIGLSKASWASCIMRMNLTNTDIKNIWSGIPAWVKRHVGKCSSSVKDNAENRLPIITLTNSLPWADKVMSENDYRDCLTVVRERFYKSMESEIKGALKAQAAA
jgi:hypothetical protein